MSSRGHLVFFGSPIAHEHGGASSGLNRRRRGTTRGVVTYFNFNKGLSHFNNVAHLSVQFRNDAHERARQFHRGLGGFNINEWLIERHGVADAHFPRHNLCFGEPLAHVGHEKRAVTHNP